MLEERGVAKEIPEERNQAVTRYVEFRAVVNGKWERWFSHVNGEGRQERLSKELVAAQGE